VQVSAIFPETRSVRGAIDLAVGCEGAGLDSMFLGTGFGFDPIMALALAGRETTTLRLGTSVVPTWPRHPVVLAQQAATANAATGGRFRLGIGPSHAMVMGMYGIAYDRPVGHTEEYVTILRALLDDGRVSHQGERYRVTAFVDVEDGGRPPILLGVLRGAMCRLAGALADGAIPWLAPPSYLADVVVPQVRAGAEAVGREAPPVVASFPVVLAGDRDEARAVANRDLAIYPRVATYAAMMQAAGVPDADRAADDGWTDAMFDAVVPWGDENTLAARIKEYADAGAAEVLVSPFGAPTNRLMEVLSDIAHG
jgi:5,10-methylenetetrahydromethanopterin reductase